MKWTEVDLTTLSFAGKKGGGTRVTNADGTPLRFQIPTGRVMYNGLSDFKSVTIEVPIDFVQWWTTKLESEIASGCEPFRSNVKDGGLRVKVDASTHFFNESKKSTFPALDEGAFKGDTVSCIIEVSGVYYFQDVYGLIVRAHQVVLREKKQASATVEEASGESIKGFAFLD